VKNGIEDDIGHLLTELSTAESRLLEHQSQAPTFVRFLLSDKFFVQATHSKLKLLSIFISQYSQGHDSEMYYCLKNDSHNDA